MSVTKGACMAITGELAKKYAALERYLESLGSAAVAFSAGVDSTLLLAVAHDVLEDAAVAFTAASPANPQRETDEAARFCAERGIHQVVFAVDELQLEGFEHNPADRCYRCKTHLFGEMAKLADEHGLACIVEGSNVDDLGDYRPGRQAIQELGVKSPLLDCGFTKQDIRDLSHELGLPTWEKPSFACLYSRFAYGDLLTPEKLRRVDDAEQFLMDQGFKTVRVRMVGDAARIELAPEDITTAATAPLRDEIASHLKALGFTYVSLDLQGYRTGSMNQTLGS